MRLSYFSSLVFYRDLTSPLLTNDLIASKIYFLRGEKELLDSDLALLYGVETKRLKEAVRRNIARFPEDFMFELTFKEWSALRTQIASLEGRGRYSKYPPMAFAEQGVAMLSGILNSSKAIETNVAIMPARRSFSVGGRTFVALRRLMESNKDLAAKIRQLENKYDAQFKGVFEAIQQLIRQESKKMRPVGFRIQKK